MAQKLKDLFDARMVAAIAAELQTALPSLDTAAFVEECVSRFADLELTERASHVAGVMRRHLPELYADAVAVLTASLGPRHERTDVFGFEPFRYLPHALYIARHGLDDFDLSMDAQYELTRRFTAEGSIRPFLVRYPEPALERLRQWALDPDVHVRRLVSEGTRPRLPWAMRLRAFQEDPRAVLELLELLKDDPERYVQRSVANNLNDIGKDHPEVLVEVCRRWLIDAPPGREWIVRHALRSLVKEGHRGALELLGVSAAPRVRIKDIELRPRRVRIGGRLEFAFTLTSTARREQALLVDYAVYFVKSNGSRRPKVFKLRRVVLEPLGAARLTGRVSFVQMTTRIARPGRHAIEARVNGVAFPLGEFEVGAA